jgi:hypothetical protein
VAADEQFERSLVAVFDESLEQFAVLERAPSCWRAMLRRWRMAKSS